MHLTICSWIFVLLHEVYATEINTLLLKEKNLNWVGTVFSELMKVNF